jgi:hypothetical protein
MNSNYDFNTGEMLESMMEFERMSIKLKTFLCKIRILDEKRIKFKDLLSALKEGNVQKDLSLNYYFENNTFISMSRKECVDSTEKEVAQLNREILGLKKEAEIFKIKFIDKMIFRGLDLNEIDDDGVKSFLCDEFNSRKKY